MIASGPVIGKTFIRLIRNIAEEKSSPDKLNYSQKLEDLALSMERFRIIGYINHSETDGLYVSFSKDGSDKYGRNTKGISIQGLDEMAEEIYNWCGLKGLFNG